MLFDEKGALESTLATSTTRYDQPGEEMTGVERVFDTKVSRAMCGDWNGTTARTEITVFIFFIYRERCVKIGQRTKWQLKLSII